MQRLSNMIHLAVNKHDGQFDKGGKPYILHCLKVMHYVKSEDVEVLCAAVGHDLLEDTDTTIDNLVDIGMTQATIDAIVALTKQRGQSYEQYKAAVKANAIARIVKMADLRHNSNLRRLKGVTEKDVARVAKYMQFYQELREI